MASVWEDSYMMGGTNFELFVFVLERCFVSVSVSLRRCARGVCCTTDMYVHTYST